MQTKTAIVIAIALVIIGIAVWFIPEIIYLAAALIGLVLSTISLALVSVLFKDAFAHDPNNQNKIAWFVKVEENRSVVINRGGRPTHVLRGDERPVASSAFFGLWMLYKNYIMDLIGYHVYVPYFYEPTVYELERYEVREEDGKKVYEVVTGDNSNHVRTEPFTWYFEYKGAEVNKIPFTVKGSAQVRILRKITIDTEDKENMEIEALYKTDRWNVLLDQALNSTIRGVVRRDLTVDLVIGGISKDLWKAPRKSRDPYEYTAGLIMKRLDEYEVDYDGHYEPLSTFGLDIMRIDIIDFEDELTEAEKPLLRQAILAREGARGEQLKGQAAAEAIRLKGTATAEAQRQLKELYEENPELAKIIATADALRAFAENNGGIIDAVLAAWLGKEMKK